ncbi:hypothetical protein V5799_033266 [Amblyomma americanum]|uniref:Uncharacterized protein n=1 Tax=Amblyomma americanum TaxID=6943 RepID=A0AAQ4DNT5_AMBAM
MTEVVEDTTRKQRDVPAPRYVGHARDASQIRTASRSQLRRPAPPHQTSSLGYHLTRFGAIDTWLTWTNHVRFQAQTLVHVP